MKKAGLIVTLLVFVLSVQSQIITDKVSKNVSVGFDMYTDILTSIPANLKTRTINQGFNVFATYNFKVAEGPHVFAIGAGIRTQNFYSDSRIANPKADTIVFVPIASTLSYTTSKFSVVNLDLPAEFRFRFDDKWKIGIGFKMGIGIDSKVKYVGQIVVDGSKRHIKEKKINSLEIYNFGPTLRLGYKWANIFAYYQATKVFQRDLGPGLHPLSLGLTITPY